MLSPVLQRELRTAARQAGTFRSRVFVVAIGLLVLLVLLNLPSGLGNWFFLRSLTTPGMFGRLIFAALHLGLMFTLLFLCPVLTADCLARERREGTLGLLFLTPLQPRDIVYGKCVLQVIRAVSFWLATVPLLAIPVLMGGVTGRDFGWAVLMEASVMFLGLAAGLWATARSVRWGSAMALALFFQGLLVVLTLVVADGTFLLGAIAAGAGPGELRDPTVWILLPPMVLSGALGALPTGAVPTWVTVGARASAAAVTLFSVAAFAFAVWRVTVGLVKARAREATGQDVAERSRPAGWTHREVGAGWAARRHRRLRNRNPVRWLHGSGRRAWADFAGWLAALVLLVGGLVAIRFAERDMWAASLVPGPVVMLLLAFAAAGSYRQEMEEGTLELLLVTPLSPSRLVTARWSSLGWRFGPVILAAVLVPAVWALVEPVNGWAGIVWLSSVALLPPVGMRCAFRRLTPVVGWLVTLGWGVVAPAVAALAFTVSVGSLLNLEESGHVALWFLAFVLFQAGAAFWWWGMAVNDLTTRDFMLRPLEKRADGTR